MADERNFQNPPAEDPQPLVGFRANDEWDALLAYVNGLVTEMEEISDQAIRERVFELLQGIDAIHREALTRLVRLFKGGVLDQVITDPAIRTLMELYDLMPAKAGCGDAADFATGSTPTGGDTAESQAISKNKLAEKVPIPHWVPAQQNRNDLLPGSAVNIMVEDRRLLLCRVGDEIFALAAECVRDGRPMDGGNLEGFTYTCPHHDGCYYDVRQGTRIAAPGSVECFPIRLDQTGRIQIGFDIPFKPQLPSF